MPGEGVAMIIFLRFVVIAIGSGASAAVLADDDNKATNPYLVKDNALFFGAFVQEGEGNVTAQRGSFDARTLRLDDLGSDKEYTSWLLEFRHRFNDRWAASVGAYRFNTGSQFTVTDDFNFEGREFTAGASVDLDFTLDTYIADVMYTLRRSDHFEWQVGGGLHLFNASLSLKGTLALEGENVGEAETRSKASLTAPVPNLRTTGFYALNDKWSVFGTLGWLSANVDQYSGDFLYGNVRLQYQITQAFGLSAGFQHVSADIEETVDRGFNRFDMKFNGFTAAFSYLF